MAELNIFQIISVYLDELTSFLEGVKIQGRHIDGAEPAYDGFHELLWKV
jgi:hypothetical protein